VYEMTKSLCDWGKEQLKR